MVDLVPQGRRNAKSSGHGLAAKHGIAIPIISISPLHLAITCTILGHVDSKCAQSKKYCYGSR